MKIKLRKDWIIGLSILGVILCCFAIGILVKTNATTSPIFGSHRLPVPKGSKAVFVEGNKISGWYECKQNAAEVEQFYANYLSKLKPVYKKEEPLNKGFYDSESKIVILSYKVLESQNGKTTFSVRREIYGTAENSV